MARNNIQKLNPTQTLALAIQMKSTIGIATPNDYGVSTAQITALADGVGNLSMENDLVVAAKAAYHRAVVQREAAHTACAKAMASAARTAYATPTVTDAMIAALGLSPRSTTKTKIRPVAPAKLNAALQPTGEIALSWSRSGNPQGTTFALEAQSASGAWTMAGITTKAKLVFSGVPAGVPTNFRVTAIKDDVASAASPVATVYPAADAAPSLRLAA